MGTNTTADEFVQMFLESFAAAVENDEDMNGGDVVDRVVELVKFARTVAS